VALPLTVRSLRPPLCRLWRMVPMSACSCQPGNGDCVHPESLFEQSRPVGMGGWLVVRDGARSVDLSRLLGHRRSDSERFSAASALDRRL
jgi:hypothetical protein